MAVSFTYMSFPHMCLDVYMCVCVCVLFVQQYVAFVGKGVHSATSVSVTYFHFNFDYFFIPFFAAGVHLQNFCSHFCVCVCVCVCFSATNLVNTLFICIFGNLSNRLFFKTIFKFVH